MVGCPSAVVNGVRIRRPLLALGMFSFGVGVTFLAGGIPLDTITYYSDHHIYYITYDSIIALVSFAVAGILLAWSFAE